MYNIVQTGHLSNKKRAECAMVYFRKRLKRIKKFHEIMQKEITKEGVHELRIEIKKVKALLMFLRWGQHKFQAQKYYRPFKAIFKKAGDVRTLQIESEILQRYISDSSDSYLAVTHQQIFEKTEDLKKMFKSDILRKLRQHKREISYALKMITEKRMRRFLKLKVKKLERLLEDYIFKEQRLHIIRKNFKRFYFIVKMAYPKAALPEPWNRLLELLGEWHDNQVVIEHLRKAIYCSQFTQDEIDRLCAVRREMIEHRESLLLKIVRTYYFVQGKDVISRADNARSVTLQETLR